MTANANLVRIARDVIPPRGATAPIAVVEQTPGGRLPHPLEAYPNGIGGSTRYGVAWLVDGRTRTKPFVTFERARDAFALTRILRGDHPASRPAAPAVSGGSTGPVALPPDAAPGLLTEAPVPPLAGPDVPRARHLPTRSVSPG